MPANVLKPLNQEITLSATANTVSSGGIVRLVETGGTAASLITVKDLGGNTIGSITIAKGGELYLRKSRTDTLTSSAGTVVAVSIAG
jgi:hypothetical protein